MTREDLHQRASAFQQVIRARNRRESIAALLVIAFFTYQALTASQLLIQTGAGMIVLAATYVCWKIHGFRPARPGSAVDQVTELVAFHRAELARQRQSLATVSRWYIAPFAPGFLLLGTGITVSGPGAPSALALALFTATIGLFLLMSHRVVRLNAVGVTQLDAAIAELDREHATR